MKKLSKSKKALAVLLSLVLVLGNVGLFAVWFGPRAGAGSVTRSSSQKSGDLTFVVPEVIYLAPDARSWNTAVTSPFQFYVNNTSTGAATAKAAETTGKIYYNLSGASNATLSYTFFNEAVNQQLTGSVTLSSTSIARNGSVNITGGRAPSLGAGETGCYLRWELSFMDPADGQAKKAYAWSYVYKPYVVPIAAASAAGTGSSDSAANWAGTLTSLSGFHSIIEYGMPDYSKSDSLDGYEDNNYLKFTEADLFVSSANTAYVGGTAVSSNQQGVSSWSGHDTSKAGERRYLSFAETSGTPKSYAYVLIGQNKLPTEYNNGGADTNQNWGVRNTTFAKYRGNNVDIVTKAVARSIGAINIDVSRYSNLNQIPNLGVALVVTSDAGCDDWTGHWWMADHSESSWNHRSTWYKTKEDDLRDAAMSRDYIFAGQGNDWHHREYDTNEGVRYAGSWYRTLLNTGNASQMYYVKSVYGNTEKTAGSNYDANAVGYVGLKATYSNKGALRTAVQNAIKKMAALGVDADSNGNLSSMYFETDNSYKWYAFQSAYKNAVLALTKVDSTADFNSLATALNNALNALCTKVTLDYSNGGTPAAGQDSTVFVTVGTNQSANYIPNAPTRPDYTFVGWNTDRNALTGSKTLTVGYNETYYAIWTPVQYTISFNGNGATSGEMAPQTVAWDTTATLTSNAFAREQQIVYNAGAGTADKTSDTALWSFDGWDKEDGTVVADGASIRNFVTKTATTLKARWTGGEVTLPNAVQNGYDFLGWYNKESGSGRVKLGDAGDTFVATANQTMFAGWKPAAYTITYDNNGAISTQTYMITGTQRVSGQPANAPAHYTWGGWLVTANDGNWDMTDPITTSMLVTGKYGNVTLTANWIPETYGITVNAGTGATVSNLPEHVDYNGTHTFNVTLADGYDKDAPAVSAVNADVAVSGEGKDRVVTVSNVTGEVTVTVTPVINAYRLTLNGEGFTSADNGKGVDYGETLSFSVTMDAQYAKTAPTVQIEGGETLTAASVSGATYSYVIPNVTDDVTVTVTPNLNVYTVTFYDETGANVLATAQVSHGDVPAWPEDDAPAKAATAQYSYVFEGWAARKNGPKLSALPAATADAAYYALFSSEINKYTVTFMDDAGETVLDQVTEIPYGGSVSYTKPDAPTKAEDVGYTYSFVGWAKAPNSTMATGVTAVYGETVYYAVFSRTAKKYTVSFYGENDELLQESLVDYGKRPVYAGVTPHKDQIDEYNQYEFDGWAAERDGEALPALPIVSGDAAYYAVFKLAPAEYTVVYANHNGSRLQTTVCYYGDAVPAYEGAVPTRKADAQYTYTFAGWNTDPAAGAPAALPETVTGNLVIYAIYETELQTYTVTFKDDNNGLLGTRTFAYGETPSFDGDLTREPTAYWHYVFTRWNESFVPVTGDATYIAIFDKEDHDYANADMAGQSCTDGGTVTYTCSCGMTKTVEKTPGPHTFGAWTEIAPATETENGMEERVCTVCGATEHRVIPASGSTPSDPGSAGNDCPLCGKTHSRDILDWIVGLIHQLIYLVRTFSARFAR